MMRPMRHEERQPEVSTKYTLSSRAPFAATWTKTPGASLRATLETAWRKHQRGWSIDSITRGQSVFLSSEELMQAFTQMDNLAREQPQRSRHEIAEQVIQEMNKAEADESATG